MIKLEFNSRKELAITESSRIYKGENLINSIQLTAVNPNVGDYSVGDCDFYLHVVLPDGSYYEYALDWTEEDVPFTATVPVTLDITAEAQMLKLFVEIKSGSIVVGKTNTVELQVWDTPDEQESLTPRSELEETIAFLEQELESAATITEALDELKGDYDTVAERIEDDELHIASNSGDISTAQSAIISLTAALHNKIDDLPSSVKTANIAPAAVTTAKIADEAVTMQKLSTAVQDILGTVPEVPVCVESQGTLSDASALNSSGFCYNNTLYPFTISGALAASVGIVADSPCELRFVNSYQIITQTDTQQFFARRVTRVAPSFAADSWAEVINPAITTLQTTVGALNTQLENALNGGV